MAFDYEESKQASPLERRFIDFVKRDDEEKWKQALERIRDLEAQLATKLGAKDAQIDQLRLEIAHLHAQLAEARHKLDGMIAANDHLELELEESRAEVERLQSALKNLRWIPEPFDKEPELHAPDGWLAALLEEK